MQSVVDVTHLQKKLPDKKIFLHKSLPNIHW
jgi:hypothetical protein